MKRKIHASYSGKKWRKIVDCLLLQEGGKNPDYKGEKQFYVLPIGKRAYPRFHICAELSRRVYKRGRKVFISIHIDWKRHIDSTDTDPLITELIAKMAALTNK